MPPDPKRLSIWYGPSCAPGAKRETLGSFRQTRTAGPGRIVELPSRPRTLPRQQRFDLAPQPCITRARRIQVRCTLASRPRPRGVIELLNLLPALTRHATPRGSERRPARRDVIDLASRPRAEDGEDLVRFEASALGKKP
jgi:hypothetical protein